MTLLARGLWSPQCAAYQRRARADAARLVAPEIAGAEAAGVFPRGVLEALGREGHLRERWTGGPWGDLGRAAILYYELGRALSGGLGLGVSLHLEAASSILRRTRPRPGGRDLAREALAGKLVACLAVTEESGGSDLGGVRLRARRAAGGWTLDGGKKYISLGQTADVAVVLARTGGPGVAGLTLFAVPRGDNGYAVERLFSKLGTRSLDTAELRFSRVRVRADARIGPEGGGYALVAAALTGERLAAVAQLIGTLDGCAAVARRRLIERGGPSPLWRHQALRHRAADLSAASRVLWRSLLGTAWALEHRQAGDADVAALKLLAAPMVERGVSEALQLLGGAGYTTEYPVERALRDCRLARIGAGTDEIMREILASAGGIG